MLPADSPFASPFAPGPHPATAELRAYAAGTLSPADEHRIEAHALDCERCTELLDGFSMSDAATTDQALAQLRTRLQVRVADDLAEPLLLPASRPLWPRLAAGVALLGAVGAGLWGWEHQPPADVATTSPRQTAAPAASPAAAAPTATAIRPAVPPVAALSQSVAKAPAPAPARPTEYAAARPRLGPAQKRAALSTVAPVASVADGFGTEAVAADKVSAIQSVSAPTEAKVLASRMASPVPANEPEAVSATDEAVAAPRAVAAAPRVTAPRIIVADSATVLSSAVSSNQLVKSKVFEGSVMVRDKPMPATIAIAPAPITGTPAFRDYLRRKASEFELEEGAKPLSGTVRLRFTVGADGKLSNLQVVRGMRTDYNEEALRLVCEGPAWRPGIAGGRRAALPVEVAVSF